MSGLTYPQFNSAYFGDYGCFARNFQIPQNYMASSISGMPGFNYQLPSYNFPSFMGGGYSGSSGTGTGTSSSSSASSPTEDFRQKYYDAARKKNQSTNFLGITKKQEEIILKQHSTSYEPKVKFNSLGGQVASQAAMAGAMTNINIIKHPLSTAQVAFSKNSATNKMFNSFVASNANTWKANEGIMREAYFTMHKMEVRSKSKWFGGTMKKRLSTTEFDALRDEMKRALASGNVDEIAQATERLKFANVNNGWIPRAKNWVKTKVFRRPGNSVPDVITQFNEAKGASSSTIAANASTLVNAGKMTFGRAWKEAVGGPLGKFAAAIQVLAELPNVITAFKKDTKTGLKQTGQSVIKAGVAWGSWTLGQAGGIWLGAKIGAALGSVVPGLGTAIGAVTGVIGGLLVSTVANYFTRKAVGDNVVNEVKTENLAKTEEGKVEIVQELIRQAQAGEIEDKATLEIVQKMAKAYEEQAQQIQAQQATQAPTQVQTA